MGLELSRSSINVAPSRGPGIGLNKISPPRGPSSFKISSPEFRSSFSKTKSPTLASRLNLNTRPQIKSGNPFFEKSIALARGRNALGRVIEGSKNSLGIKYQEPNHKYQINSKNQRLNTNEFGRLGSLAIGKLSPERPFRGHLSDLFRMPKHQVNTSREGVNNIVTSRNFHGNISERSINRPLNNSLIKFDRATQRLNIEQPVIYSSLRVAAEASNRNINQNLNIRPTLSRFSINERPSQVEHYSRNENASRTLITPKQRVAEIVAGLHPSRGLQDLLRVEPVVQRFEFKQLQQTPVNNESRISSQIVKPEVSPRSNQLTKTIDAFKTAGMALPEAFVKQAIKGELIGSVLGVPGLSTIASGVMEQISPQIGEKLGQMSLGVADIIPHIKVDTEIQRAIKVLSNPAKVDPEISAEYRDAVKAQILGLAKGSQSEGVSQKTAELIASFKTTLRLLVKREVLKKVEREEEVKDEEIVAEVDDVAMKKRFEISKAIFEAKIKENQESGEDGISGAEYAAILPTEADTERNVSSEPLKDDKATFFWKTVIGRPDGSYTDTKKEIAEISNRMDAKGLWQQVTRIINKNVAIRFRRNITTRRATKKEVERVFEGKADVVSIIQTSEALPQAA